MRRCSEPRSGAALRRPLVELDVIVVAHQSAGALARCFSGVPEAQRHRFIVVDNASTDGSAEIAKAHGARVLQEKRNLGFGRAANTAARRATASHLCFLNPDCRPTAQLFEAILDRLRADPDACLAIDLCEPGGRLVSGRQPGYSAAKLLYDALVTNYRPGRLTALLQRVPSFHDPRWFWAHGACFVIGRERFRNMGGFDARYFLYMEDVDFGRRLYRAGGSVVALHHAVHHQARRGADVSPIYRLWHLNVSRVRYAACHHGLLTAMAVAALSAPGFLAHMVKDPRCGAAQ